MHRHYEEEKQRVRATGDGGGESLRTLELESESRAVEACTREAMEALRRARGPTKVPDYYCCKSEKQTPETLSLSRTHERGYPCAHLCLFVCLCAVTMEIMLDPVTTPDGITYERCAIIEHLKKVGRFDPVTRRSMEAHNLVSNLAIKEAIGAYLESHPWAYESAL